MPNITDREKSPMRSLERALHLLAILQEAGCSMRLTELGHASQLSKPTVLRMLLVLEKYGFAEKRQGVCDHGASGGIGCNGDQVHGGGQGGSLAAQRD